VQHVAIVYDAAMSTEPNTTAAPMSSPTTNDDAATLEIAALTKRAQFLNVQYGVLFAASMLLLVYNWSGGRTTVTTIAWAASLLGPSSRASCARRW
jgi:hypothetical protein